MQEHHHRFHDQHNAEERARMLGSGERREWLKINELIEKAGILPGMVCVDLGCGAGALSVPLAEAVGTGGTVYAVDRDPQLLSWINENAGMKNLITKEADAAETGLPSGAADACFLIMVLHEVPAEATLTEVYRILKPGGKAVLLEWRLDNGRPHPPLDERISQEDMENLFTKIGLSGFTHTEWTPDLYMAIGVK